MTRLVAHVNNNAKTVVLAPREYKKQKTTNKKHKKWLQKNGSQIYTASG